MSDALTVAFSARLWYADISSKLYISIKEKHCKDLKGIFICSNQKEKERLMGLLNGQRDFETIVVSEFFRENWDSFTESEFLRYETRYDCTPIWKAIYTDRFLIFKDRDYCVKITVGYFRLYEKIFGEHQVDYFYDEAVSTIQTYVGYVMCPAYGVQYVSQMSARGAGLDDRLHYFITETNQLDLEIDDSHPLDDYSSEEIERADAYLKEFEEKDIKPACISEAKDYPHLTPKLLKCIPLYFYLLFDKNNNDPYFYMFYRHEREAITPLGDIFRYRQTKKYIQPVDYSKKFVYFPLHFQPESSTLCCAPKYEKQIVLIDALAKSLPGDTYLYLKEHYSMLGKREKAFYEQLKQYPNVVMVDPWENSRVLIEHAEAVVTLTGTAGFEAMLLRKPVLIGGRILYENAPGVVRLDDFTDRYVPEMAKWTRPSREDTVRYLCAYFRSLHPGTLDLHCDNVFSDENIGLLADSLYEYMNDKK